MAFTPRYDSIHVKVEHTCHCAAAGLRSCYLQMVAVAT